MSDAWRGGGGGPDDDGADELALVMPFLSDDPKFCLGWECGMLYQRMRDGADEIEVAIHADNDEQVLLVARRLHYACEIEPLSEGWATVRLTRLASA